MTALLRRCRRFFAAPPGPAGRADAAPARLFHEHTRRFTAAQTLVHGFYAFLLYLAVTQLTELHDLAGRSMFLPLWPVRWLGWLPASATAANGGTPAAVRALFFFYLGTSVFGAVCSQWRAARLAAFLGLLEYVALKNSYGKIGHSLHLPLLVAGLMVFLPRGWHRPAPLASRALRQGTLLVFWLGGAAVLLSYTMSGIGKLGGALYQIAHWQPNAFTPGALGALIAQRLLQVHSESFLGAWIINHPWLTWPAMPTAVYLEFFSLWIAFRPAAARPWAALLIVFHIGTFFTMTITFPQSCFLLALFFFRSPFAPLTLRWNDLLRSVPLVGEAAEIFSGRQTA